MIIVTVIRISGIKSEGQVDQVWETYFTIAAAEIGIVLTTVSAFRTLYVSRQKKNPAAAEQSPEYRTMWYSDVMYHLRRAFLPSLWRIGSKPQQGPEGLQSEENGIVMQKLPDIPRAYMTGFRTFIRGHGKERKESRVMESHATQEDDDTWPLHSKGKGPQHQV